MMSDREIGKMPSGAKSIVEVRDVTTRFVLRGRHNGAVKHINAVDGVSLQIRRGETLGLVGESGCGKTTLGRTILALQRASAGAVQFEGRSLFDLPPAALKTLRRRMQLIFQDPYASLDPRKPVGRSVRSLLDIHGVGGRRQRDARVAEMFRLVGLDPSYVTRFPHEFSGGQRQRIVIARALILDPSFVVCDEPVSALDVSIQAQILNLMKDLQARIGITYLFISHNLAVIDHVADRVAIMYFGRIVEIAPRAELFKAPRHPYTRMLLAAIPKLDPRQRLAPPVASGDPPDLANLPSGCRFRSRCAYATSRCESAEPTLEVIDEQHMVACWHPRN